MSLSSKITAANKAYGRVTFERRGSKVECQVGHSGASGATPESALNAAMRGWELPPKRRLAPKRKTSRKAAPKRKTSARRKTSRR
jgi:hypothetical protein